MRSHNDPPPPAPWVRWFMSAAGRPRTAQAVEVVRKESETLTTAAQTIKSDKFKIVDAEQKIVTDTYKLKSAKTRNTREQAEASLRAQKLIISEAKASVKSNEAIISKSEVKAGTVKHHTCTTYSTGPLTRNACFLVRLKTLFVTIIMSSIYCTGTGIWSHNLSKIY